ncbi:hypothetical protein [Natrialba sp. SSL1]|uniref:hypothetical protein n=1 Tax=Natrialba sp. SSL1 TaxID=1869245 RepID=UPI0008F844B7|nr:hypothetical protein [Natrialba sp. SSL1]OIB58526.1 hypothetical protein BBD46_09425 [Natrialba sp. SSL1]
MPTAYCGECEWTHTVTAEETTDLDLAMIDHHVDTGHSPIERGDLVEPISAAGGSDDASNATKIKLESAHDEGDKQQRETAPTTDAEAQTELE